MLGQPARARYGGTRPTAASPAAGRRRAGVPAKYSSSSRAAGSSRAGACEDPGADPVGQGLQDRVVVLAGVRHPDQPVVGRGEQQRADRAVDGAVGDVQDAFGLRVGGEPVVQPAQVRQAGRGRPAPGRAAGRRDAFIGVLLSWRRRPGRCAAGRRCRRRPRAGRRRRCRRGWRRRRRRAGRPGSGRRRPASAWRAAARARRRGRGRGGRQPAPPRRRAARRSVSRGGPRRG